MAGAVTHAEVRQKVKEILRRDLKLGPDVRIDDDMPLFNSDADLDSLDMLLLVSSVEREFGFRIPNEAVGETVFQTVRSLSTYIAENRELGSGPGAEKSAGSVNLLDRLPHGEPFRFVDKLVDLKAGGSAEGVWSLSGREDFFAGHFPDRPLVPGVLIAEALAQLSGLIVGSDSTTQGMLAHVDVRFEKPVAPPTEIHLYSRLTRHVGALQQFEVSATVAGEMVARGTLALHIASAPLAGS